MSMVDRTRAFEPRSSFFLRWSWYRSTWWRMLEMSGGEWGFEATSFATSVPGIYAVGDVRAESVEHVHRPLARVR